MKTFILIGDIHGVAVSLTALIDALGDADLLHHDTSVISLGDAINKGPDSRGVLDTLTELGQRHSVQLIRGNHEAEFLDFLRTGNVGRLLQIGGATTLRSYGVTPTGGPLVDQLLKKLPSSHFHLLHSGPMRITYKSILLTHKFAGAREGLNIHGHAYVSLTPTLSSKNSINLDTGCGSGGPLTALHYPSGRIFQAQGDQASELEEIPSAPASRVARRFFNTDVSKDID